MFYIGAALIMGFCENEHLQWLIAPIDLPPITALSHNHKLCESPAAAAAQLHHPLMFAVLSILSADWWDVHRYPALTEVPLAGHPNCLQFIYVGHKTRPHLTSCCKYWQEVESRTQDGEKTENNPTNKALNTLHIFH